MNRLPWKRALVVAPHTDDEYGCAGTMARLVIEGCEVGYLALSDCVESVPEGMPQDTLRVEATACMIRLGVPTWRAVEISNLPVRHFPDYRQRVLDTLIEWRARFAPDVVFAPSRDDIHQDHATVAHEVLRAFKHTTILGYELPQNSVAFDNAVYVHLTDAHVGAKLNALACYESQQHRPYMDPEVIGSIMRLRGMQAGTMWAEAFEPIRIHL